MNNPLVETINNLMLMRTERESIRKAYVDRVSTLEEELSKVAPEICARLQDARQCLAQFDIDYADQLTVLEVSLKAEVAKLGASVDGTLPNPTTGKVLRVGWYNGARKVNIERFDGYCISHPEAKELIEQGEPVVKILEVKPK